MIRIKFKIAAWSRLRYATPFDSQKLTEVKIAGPRSPYSELVMTRPRPNAIEDGQRVTSVTEAADKKASAPMARFDSCRAASVWIFMACGIWLLGLGAYFIAVRPPLLPEDLRFMGTTLEQARAALPGLEGWLQRVFTVLGGFMAGAGVLTIFTAWGSLRARSDDTAPALALAIAGSLTVGVMSATNFALRSDFKWVLLIPTLAWTTGLVLAKLRPIARRNGPSSDS